MSTRLVARGIAASGGVAYGKAFLLRDEEISIFHVSLHESDVPLEVKRLQNAVASSKRQLNVIREKVTKTLGENHAYFLDAQICALDDPLLVERAASTVREHRVNAEWAIHHSAGQIARRFAEMKDAYLSERAKDIEDVTRRIVWNLMGAKPRDLSTLEEPHILVASRLAPSDAIQLHRDRVLGLVLDVGGITSHTAIIARSLAIPAVIGLHNLSAAVVDQTPVLLDGDEGQVILNPSEADVNAYRAKKAELADRSQAYRALRDVVSETRSGERVHLAANIEFPSDVEGALEHGAEGVGLYRTELLYLNKSPNLPTEEDHYQAYKAVLESMGEKPVVIRTLDLGGEKFFHSILQKDNFNPVLGLRAIRYCLQNEAVFLPQLRGLLRASAHGRCLIMVPMVVNLDEIRRTKALLESVRKDLRLEGKTVAERIPFGIMVEVPATALAADTFAREADFFSVGTNDLIQYTLAIERGNDTVSYLYEPLHPSVLRLLDSVARAAHTAGIDLHLCGEMTSDPALTELLVGLGYRNLSMNARRIHEVKAAVRRIRISDAQALAREVLSKSDASEIRALLAERASAADGAQPAPSGPGAARPGTAGVIP
ncbi:MAG: phosphoenolpyruvate--protein phosphotransferase [Acidobacteriota bacterium]|nr:MAG: phosphoenolpyruvate--protein phosphotransferase [Acidobacteriota bacterium]